MTRVSFGHITELLAAWGNGSQAAFNELVPLVYDELRRIARRHLEHERAGHTLQTTALAHEAYIRLARVHDVRWHDRAHFFALAAQLIRRILVDYARARRYDKRGGGVGPLPLDEALVFTAERSRDLTALDDSLCALAKLDPRKARVVEMRFFGGLSAEEAAVVLGVSPDTVLRDWKLAKAWLGRDMTKGAPHGA
ncbi:MAG TPA: sigma-70 family RNA polymerase sigma factor [Bryobacteraceae bacterium]|jgi:RNA polymerase sigma factor (TIGR02999 family)|nr:sigma-70 family RNA polymerase sigma factor [Bryobacteraceae bacterium]